MSQTQTLTLLKQFNKEFHKPARPVELTRFGIIKGVIDEGNDNPRANVNRDLNNLVRWGLVRKWKANCRVALYEPLPERRGPLI